MKSSTVSKCLPTEQREVYKLPRAYLANVIYTLVGDKFRKWVEQKIEERNEKIMQEQNMAIDMDPEVYQAFKASNYVSGKSSSFRCSSSKACILLCLL